MLSTKAKIKIVHEHISKSAKPDMYRTIDGAIRDIANTTAGESRLYNDITSSAKYTGLIKQVNNFFDYVEKKYKKHIYSAKKDK